MNRHVLNTEFSGSDLASSAPDDQLTRMAIVCRRVAEGDLKEAARHLRVAASDGDSSWHDRAENLAEYYEAMGA